MIYRYEWERLIWVGIAAVIFSVIVMFVLGIAWSPSYVLGQDYTDEALCAQGYEGVCDKLDIQEVLNDTITKLYCTGNMTADDRTFCEDIYNK